jgi:putative (di)nucleoside polyphosphate hydrolase
MTTAEQKKTELYRPCVGIVLLNAQKKVFVGERIDKPGAWQMPQGGIDEGEDIPTAAFRELGEEIGCSKAEIIRIAPEKIRYDLPDDLVARLWNSKYRGQEQTWIAARFTGQDHEINLNAHNPAEFMNWQWVDLAETVNLIVPFKRETYRKIIMMFSDLV